MTYRDLARDEDRSQRQQIKQYEIDHYAEKYGLSSSEAEDFLAATGEVAKRRMPWLSDTC